MSASPFISLLPPVETEKPRFPRGDALAVVRELLPWLGNGAVQLIVAGSLRRRKLAVGDIEFLYIPGKAFVEDPEDLFGHKRNANSMDRVLTFLLEGRVIEKRLSVDGHESWGEANKYARHVASGIPIDFFSATERNWANQLVCRTGGAENNKQICAGAIERGWKWNPYGEGFTRESTGEIQRMHSEAEVFAFAGLPYREPWERK